MIKTALTSSAWPVFAIVPVLHRVQASWLHSESFSPLHWRAKWIGARESIQALSDHPAGHINEAMMDGIEEQSRVWRIK